MCFLNLIRKTVTVVCLLSIFTALFGCGKNTPAHSADQIKTISISCGHMDFSRSYSFALRESNGVWMLDAECFIDDFDKQISISSKIVDTKKATQMLDIIKSNDVIKYVETYKKKRSPFMALDETMYGLSLKFDDGEIYSVDSLSSAGSEIESLFYQLAEEYDS